MALDGVPVTPLQAIQEMNRRAGAHGVGRIDIVEDRLVGIKSREIYEAPGAMALIEAHRELENVTVEREQARFKKRIGAALDRARLRRHVVLPAQALARRLHRGHPGVRVRRDPPGPPRRARDRDRTALRGQPLRLQPRHLRHGDTFDQSEARGFIEIFGLTAKLAAARDAKFGRGVVIGGPDLTAAEGTGA